MKSGSAPKILLVNPWITDFAAYDFWIKPVGLLYLGSLLRSLGYQVFLLDCLDRHHPELLKELRQASAPVRWDMTGKYHRELIEKPDVYNDIPRHYARYGYPTSVFYRLLRQLPEPDVILVTSMMTYWYPGVAMVVRSLRSVYPKTPIVLGGIYATLCPDHAKEFIQPDYLITGEAERQVAELVAEVVKGDNQTFSSEHLDDLPYPAYDLYPNLGSIALLSSRGCPFRCSFCASHLISGRFRQRKPENVVEEIGHWHHQFGIRHFAFFDDALLLNKASHIKKVLKQLIEKKIFVTFHTPNGLHAGEIDADFAGLMYQAGMRTIRLSFESVSPERQKQMNMKVTSEDLAQALENLYAAGFSHDHIGVYLLIDLPDQSIAEIIASVRFVAAHGAKINLASFSPIPGTKDWETAIAMGILDPNSDPLLTNNTIYPLKNKTKSYRTFQNLELWVKAVNAATAQGEQIPEFRD